jgi:hypothetical protein
MMPKKLHASTLLLLRLMKKHNLNQADVGRLCGCARNSVHYWLKESPVIPEHRLRILKFELNAT